MTRPILNTNISTDDFINFYWLKTELVAFCKTEGLSRKGGKIELANRIENYLRTGKKEVTLSGKVVPTKSTFDWKQAPLSLRTPITDNYKNTENVRAFFQTHLGKSFKFNVKFMNWMKTNIGKTLAEAIQEWKRLHLEKKQNTSPKEIAPQFEYNRYIRDFLADNPHLPRATAIEYWKLKKARRGDNQYRKSDLEKM